MATQPIFSSDAALKEVNSETKISDQASYHDGVLSWDRGQLREEDIITITKTKSSESDPVVGYTIWSLVPADPSQPAPEVPFKLSTIFATSLPKAFLDEHIFQGLPAYVDHEVNALYVVISTLSGTGLAPRFFDDILEPLLRVIGLSESDYKVVRTQSAESVNQFSQSELLVQANQGRKQTVFVLSGDGGIVDTINGLLESGVRTRYIFDILLFHRRFGDQC